MIRFIFKINLAPIDQIVAITGIEQFSTEGGFDFVSFFEPTSNILLAQLTGNLNSINPIYSIGRTLLVRFNRLKFK